MNVLLSAYACEPGRGSEPGVGWNQVCQISRFHTVWALTRSNNREIIESVFRHRTHYLVARRNGEVCGVLPLAEIRSRLFGHSLVSLPFAVYGGPAADDVRLPVTRSDRSPDRRRTSARDLPA